MICHVTTLSYYCICQQTLGKQRLCTAVVADTYAGFLSDFPQHKQVSLVTPHTHQGKGQSSVWGKNRLILTA